MPRSDRLPSKWWFWVFPAVGAGYIAVGVALLALASFLPGLAGECTLYAGVHVGSVVYAFGDWLDPVLEIFNPDDDFNIDAAITLVIWMLAAMLLGAVCYGAALIVYAVLPGEGPGGEQSDASQ